MMVDIPLKTIKLLLSLAVSHSQDYYLDEVTKYTVDLYKDHYVQAGMLSNLKTNNKILNVLGSIFAKENDLDNCILVNDNKQVAEALQSNLFLLLDRRFIPYIQPLAVWMGSSENKLFIMAKT